MRISVALMIKPNFGGILPPETPMSVIERRQERPNYCSTKNVLRKVVVFNYLLFDIAVAYTEALPRATTFGFHFGTFHEIEANSFSC